MEIRQVRFSDVFRCDRLECVTAADGRHGILASCSPAVFAQDVGFPAGLSELLVFPRFEGDDIWQPDSFPIFVLIAISPAGFRAGDAVALPDLVTLAWGELYRTETDAIHHVFDQHPDGRPHE